jgi:hypothetical protein
MGRVFGVIGFIINPKGCPAASPSGPGPGQKTQASKAAVPAVRALGVLATVAVTLLAGCGAPSDGSEPDRPSVVLPGRIVDGERLDLNASFVVSSWPEEGAPVFSPDRPMNCFRIETDTGEKTYLGGAVLELEWTAASVVTDNLTVTASNFPGGSWRAASTSPLWLNPIATDDQPVSLPMLVAVAPTGANTLDIQTDQEVRIHIVVGLLESLIDSLVIVQAACPP